MPTGLERANLQDKMILGLQDFSTRVVDFIRAALKEAISAQWDVNGVFETFLGLAGSPDIIAITGNSKATDGIGNVLDVTLSAAGAGAHFQNTLGVTYYVGMTYAAIPNEIVTNPRTGIQQYRGWVDQIGFAAAPTAVSDPGTGTIVLIVDSVTEVGVSNAGRQVLVYLNAPASGATTAAIAMEVRTVVWNGTHNVVTTVGNLGQNSVSTVPANYTVVCLGIRVLRNTNLFNFPGVVFIGTTLGVGAGNAPVSFDTSLQRLLKAFQDASQILFSAYKWLTAGTVQEALQQVVDVLANNNPTPGAARIGVRAGSFSAKAPMAAAPAGGLGNVADGTFNGTTDTVSAALLAGADNSIRRARGWTATFCDQQGFSGYIGDYANTALGAQMASSGTYFLRLPTTLANKYILSNLGDVAHTQSLVLGEISDTGSDPTKKTNVTTLTGVTGTAVYRGTFSRVYLDTGHNGLIQLGSSVVGNNYIFEDFGFRAGHVRLSDFTTAAPQPFHLRNGIIQAQAGDNAPSGASLSISTDGSGEHWAHGLIENVVFYTPLSTQAGGVAAFSSVLSSGTIGFGTAKVRPITFRNCVFIQASDVLLIGLVGGQEYIFEGCTFIGGQGFQNYLFEAVAAHVIIRHCYFYAPEGNALALPGCSGVVEGNVIIADGTSSQTSTDPQILLAYGVAGGGALYLTDNQIVIGASASRPTGGAVNPLVQIGNNDFSVTHVNGLHIRYNTSTAVNIHRSATLWMRGNSNRVVNTFRNVSIDFGGLTRTVNGVSIGSVNPYPAFAVTEYVICDGINLLHVGTPGGIVNAVLLAALAFSDLANVRVDCGVNGDATHSWQACVVMDTHATIRGLVLVAPVGTGATAATAGIVSMNGPNCELEGLNSPATVFAAATTFAFVAINGDDARLVRTSLPFVKQDVCSTILLNNCNRCQVLDYRLAADGSTAGASLIAVTGGSSTSQGRQNLISNGFIAYNGTSDFAIYYNAVDGMVVNLMARRLAGANTAVDVVIGGSIIQNNVVISTV